MNLLPSEHPQLAELVAELFAVHGRNASQHAHKAWLLALKDRPLSDVTRIIRHLIEESSDLPTPARVISALRDEKPAHIHAAAPDLCEPSKTTLLAARRMLEMYGENAARESYGNYAVNILLKNPATGYSMVNPKTYGGILPENIKADLASGVRHAGGVIPRNSLEAHLPRRTVVD